MRTWWRSALGPELRAGIPQNVVLVLSGHLLRLTLGLFSSAVLARGLGPEGLSIFAVIGATTMIALTIADFGLSKSAIRQIIGALAADPLQAFRTAGSFARLRLLAAVMLVV